MEDQVSDTDAALLRDFHVRCLSAFRHLFGLAKAKRKFHTRSRFHLKCEDREMRGGTRLSKPNTHSMITYSCFRWLPQAHQCG